MVFFRVGGEFNYEIIFLDFEDEALDLGTVMAELYYYNSGTRTTIFTTNVTAGAGNVYLIQEDSSAWTAVGVQATLLLTTAQGPIEEEVFILSAGGSFGTQDNNQAVVKLTCD